MLNKKIKILVVFTVLFMVGIAQIPTILSATEQSVPAINILYFLNEVVLIDTERYDVVELTGPLTDYKRFEGLPYTYGKIGLYSETNNLEVTYSFLEETLLSCHMYIQSGEVNYSQQLPLEKANAASLLLQRYELYSGDSRIRDMSNILSNAPISSNETIASDNIKLEVSDTGQWTSFDLKRTFNGADYPALTLSFREKDFYAFDQVMSYYKIGNTDVKIMKTQAIDIALDRAESYSYTYKDEKVENFGIVEETIRAELEVMNRYESFELYPLWKVDLPLNETYPGSATFIRVNLWADTGEIINIRALGISGDFQPTNSTSESSESTPQATAIAALEIGNTTAITLVVIIIGALAIAGVVIIKKRSYQNHFRSF